MTVCRNGKEVTASADLEQRQEWLPACDRADPVDDWAFGNRQQRRIQLFDWLADLLPAPLALCRRRPRVEAFQRGLCAAPPVYAPDAEQVPGAVEALILGVEVQVDVCGAAEWRDLKRPIAGPPGSVVQKAQDRVDV